MFTIFLLKKQAAEVRWVEKLHRCFMCSSSETTSAVMRRSSKQKEERNTSINLSIGSNLDKNQSRLFSHDSAYCTGGKFTSVKNLCACEKQEKLFMEFQGIMEQKAMTCKTKFSLIPLLT